MHRHRTYRNTALRQPNADSPDGLQAEHVHGMTPSTQLEGDLAECSFGTPEVGPVDDKRDLHDWGMTQARPGGTPWALRRVHGLELRDPYS